MEGESCELLEVYIAACCEFSSCSNLTVVPLRDQTSLSFPCMNGGTLPLLQTRWRCCRSEVPGQGQSTVSRTRCSVKQWPVLVLIKSRGCAATEKSTQPASAGPSCLESTAQGSNARLTVAGERCQHVFSGYSDYRHVSLARLSAAASTRSLRLRRARPPCPSRAAGSPPSATPGGARTAASPASRRTGAVGGCQGSSPPPPVERPRRVCDCPVHVGGVRCSVAPVCSH